MGGPLKHCASGTLWIEARATVAGEVGWITVAGSDGTEYLTEGGSMFKIVKATILTESFELDVKESTRKLVDKTRKLKAGEVLEVHEWPRKEEQSGLFRMKAKVRTD